MNLFLRRMDEVGDLNPGMTHEELKAVAKRRGLVQWSPSNRVELVEFRGRFVNLVAVDLVTTRAHSLRYRADYWCREIGRHEMVRMGDMR